MNIDCSKSISFISIATNKYISYYIDFLDSVLEFATDLPNIRFVIFTDSPNVIKSYASLHSQLVIQVIEIDSLEWPFATLLRYRIMDSYLKVKSFDYAFYVDADMKFVNYFESADFTTHVDQESGLMLVAHPGFYRSEKFSQIFKLYFNNPLLLIKDLKIILKFGALGTWESRPESKAYVKRKLRHTYVCGAIWGGKIDSVRKLVTSLADNVDFDLGNNLIAIHNDESHLNYYRSTLGIQTQLPNFCWDSTYPNLRSLVPILEAVRKTP